MNWTILFTIVIFAILLRVFWLHVKANSAKTESYNKLEPKDKMAVLKECLLNNPTETNLSNLKDFCTAQNIDFNAESYRPFLKKQLELADIRANYKECDELYVEECVFLDQIRPIEFAEAELAKKNGKKNAYVERFLEGISRLYSDNAIDEALATLLPDYPKSEQLLTMHKELEKAVEESEADEKSLEALRQKKDSWLNELLNIE